MRRFALDSPLHWGTFMKTHRQLLIMVASTLAAGFGMACSSSSTGNTGGGSDAGPDSGVAAETGSGADSGSPVDAAPESTVNDAGCVVISNGASVVMEQSVATAEPAATGGTIPDGTYFVTAATSYAGPGGMTGPTGTTYQFTSHVSAGTYDAIESITGGKASVTTGTLVTSGTNITIQQTCPATDGGLSPYNQFSSDGTTVTLYTSSMPFSSYTFTKQ
jgi:hypothetical protein